jgi:hypothetical protein
MFKTRFFSSNKNLNGYMKWHSQKGSNGVASTLEQMSYYYDDQDQFLLSGLKTTPIDLSSYLPPRSYITKKTCKKNH